MQSRLHRLRSQQVGRDEHHARPIPGGVVESLDKLIADVHQSNSPKIPPNSRSRIKWTPARAASAAFVTPPSTPKTLVADDSVAGSNKRTEKQQQPDHIMQNHSVYLHRAPNGLRNSLDISKLPPPKERAHRQPSPAAARARPKLHAPRLPDNGRSLTISSPTNFVHTGHIAAPTMPETNSGPPSLNRTGISTGAHKAGNTTGAQKPTRANQRGSTPRKSLTISAPTNFQHTAHIAANDLSETRVDVLGSLAVSSNTSPKLKRQSSAMSEDEASLV